VLRRTFEGDDTDRTASNTGGVTYEQKVRAACLAAVRVNQADAKY
jgi:hypothetical protein